MMNRSTPLSQSIAPVADTEPNLDRASIAIAKFARNVVPQRAALVGVSGIDGSGKGYIAGALACRLSQRDLNVAVINADGWLNLPHKRFGLANPGEHFYAHAFRFDEMFSQLILPLRERRSMQLDMEYTEETAAAYRRHTYEFADIDVILLEGIFLFKRGHREAFDLRLWVECSFQTALERALRRAQEGLPPDETIRAYESIYFPAQRIHFQQDGPKSSASIVIVNDPRCSMECASVT